MGKRSEEKGQNGEQKKFIKIRKIFRQLQTREKSKNFKLPGSSRPLFWHESDTLIVNAGTHLAALSAVSGWALPRRMAVSASERRCTCLKRFDSPLFARRSRCLDYCSSSMPSSHPNADNRWPSTVAFDSPWGSHGRSLQPCRGRNLCTESKSLQREELSLWALKSFPLITRISSAGGLRSRVSWHHTLH